MLCTRWYFASPAANEILGAIAVGGYSLLVLLLTFFRPKPLFYGLTCVLLIPAAAALVVLPLAAHTQGDTQTGHIAGALFVDKVPWDAGAMGSSGTTLLIYEIPNPFLS